MSQNIRQVRLKQSSLSSPAASLHQIQVLHFLQEYHTVRMIHNINLSSSAVQSVLPMAYPQEETYEQMIRDVPCIQSEHYESSQTFKDEGEEEEEEENFTDEEEDVEEGVGVVRMQRKVVGDEEQEGREEDEAFREEDFQFVSGKSSKQSVATFLHSSTFHSQSRQNKDSTASLYDLLDPYKLQQTAYFSQVPEHQDREVGRRLSYGIEKQNKPQMINGGNGVNGKSKGQMPKVSRKAMFLDKIEKEKSRKDIVEDIERDRVFLKKFIK